jgi:hypothetical protein
MFSDHVAYQIRSASGLRVRTFGLLSLSFYPLLHIKLRNPSSVATGDLNGDGDPDLAVANGFSNNVSVLLGNGDGSFQSAANYNAGVEPSSVAIGDLNGDGDPDLAVANEWSDNVSVLINIGQVADADTGGGGGGGGGGE